MGEITYSALYRRGTDYPISVGEKPLVEASKPLMMVTYGGEFCIEDIIQEEAERLSKEIKKPLGPLEWKVGTPDWIVADEEDE